MEMMAAAMPYSEPALANAFSIGKKKLDCDALADTKDQSEELLTPLSPASTAVPASPLGATGPMSPSTWQASNLTELLDGDWAKQLNGLQHDLAAARIDLQHGAAPPEHVQLISRVVSLESDVKALRSEAEDWRHRCLELERDRASVMVREDRAQLELQESQERERSLAARTLELQLSKTDAENMSAKSEVEAFHYRRELQAKEEKLQEMQSHLRAAQTAGSELGLAQAETRDLKEQLRVKDAEYDKILLRSLKQEDVLQATASELDSMRVEASALREQIQVREAENAAIFRASRKHDESLKNAENEISLLRAEARSLREQAQAKDAEHATMLRVSKKQDESLQAACNEVNLLRSEALRLREQIKFKDSEQVALLRASKKQDTSLQTMGVDLASVREQLSQALSREVEGENARKELTQKCSTYADALRHAQKHGNNLEVEMKTLEEALSASASRRQAIADQAEAKIKDLEKALSCSEAKATEFCKDARRVKSLDLALAKSEAKQAELASEVNAMGALKQTNEKLEARINSLEAALTSSMKRQVQISKEAEELSDAHKMSNSLHAKVRSLEGALSTSEAKREELAREANLHRSRGDHQELVSHTLRLDLQDAISNSKGLADIAPPAPPLCQGIGEDAYRSKKEFYSLTRRPLSANRTGHLGTASLRQENAGSLSARAPHRQDYPRSKHSTKLRQEVLSARTPDRTAAMDRHDSKGHLISFDALGRAIKS